MTVNSGLQIRSTVKPDNTIEISLAEVEVPEPAGDEVLVRVEAAPLNPSDLFLLFGPADMRTARVAGRAGRTVLSADIPPHLMRLVSGRVGQSLPVGNEGAGVVVAAGSSAGAGALLGRTVGVAGGEMFSQYRCVKAHNCMPLPAGTSAAEGASCFVNPMTVLGMVETMRSEGHAALVHTAAASNLGQMLNRVCIEDGIELVNIVRRGEQETLLRDLGARHVCNSGSASFERDLTAALVKTGATLAFDAIGGGALAGQILGCMEAAAVREMDAYSRYGSDVHKQVYIYGALDLGPTVLARNFGFSWGLGGWLVMRFLQTAGADKVAQLRARVAAGLKTTFASRYSREISLAEALSPEVIAVYRRQATGEKFLIRPHA